MVGLVGRSSFLSSCRLGQYSRRCSGFSWVVTVATMWLVLWINSVKVLVCSCMLPSKLRDGDFADFSAFADFFSVLPIFRISADFCSFELSDSNERERNAEKKCLQNNPNRASERNAEKLLTKISLTEPQLCEPLNCERHVQCTLSFC